MGNSHVTTWEPGYAFTDYPGPWYMSEWFWATVLLVLLLYWSRDTWRYKP